MFISQIGVPVHLSKRRGPDEVGRQGEMGRARSIESRGQDENRYSQKGMSFACVEREIPRLAMVPRAQGPQDILGFFH